MKLINQYNQPSTVLVVSTYPRRGRTFDPKALATAPFTKSKLQAIAVAATQNQQPLQFVVLADVIDRPDIYQEDGHLIIRCWKRNSLNVWLSIQKAINLFPKAQTLLIEHEFGIFGLRHLITAQFPLFLLYNKLRRLRLVLVLHQVIFDLGNLSGHLQLSPRSLKVKLLNCLLRLNYRLFGLLANQLIVFEHSLKQRLSILVTAEKITSLPLANHSPRRSSQSHLRRRLGLDPDTFYLLFLGYVTWYKGADWLVKHWPKIHATLPQNQKVKLLIAGGPSSSLQIDPKYLRWYQRLLRKINHTPHILYTGVLPQEQLFQYATAANLMVMPYQVFMSASGPLTIAQSCHTPVLFSKTLKPLLASPDFQASLKQSRLTPQQVFFKDTTDLSQKINLSLTQPKFLRQLSRLTRSLRQSRTPSQVAGSYLQLLLPQENLALRPTPRYA